MSNSIDDVINKLDEFFSNPKNVEDFKNHLDEELKKPYVTQLQCNCIWCEHNGPEDPDMGTITYCLKYKANEVDKCNEECGNREWYEFVPSNFNKIEEENIMLNITDVKVNKVEEAVGRLKGYASITIDNCFVVHDIKIIEGNEGLFLAMPSRKEKDGKFKDICHPINQETRKAIEDVIMSEYNKAE